MHETVAFPYELMKLLNIYYAQVLNTGVGGNVANLGIALLTTGVINHDNNKAIPVGERLRLKPASPAVVDDAAAAGPPSAVDDAAAAAPPAAVDDAPAAAPPAAVDDAVDAPPAAGTACFFHQATLLGRWPLFMSRSRLLLLGMGFLLLIEDFVELLLEQSGAPRSFLCFV